MKILDVFIQHAKSSLNKPFSYLYDGDAPIGVGYRVLVSFGKQERLMGFVARVSETNLTAKELEEANGFRIEFIHSVVDKEPLLNDELLQLADEVSQYYIAPKISVLQAMLPQSLKPSISSLRGPKIAYEDYLEAVDVDEDGLTDKQIESLRLVAKSELILKREAGTPAIVNALLKKGKVRIVKREKQRLHLEEYEKERPHDLNFEQLRAYEDILNSDKDVVLLQGVTGSGKTEVYLHLSEEYLKMGKNILMLVPEISLTPRMVEYFSRRFQSKVAILHSELTPAEKYDEYRRIAKGEAQVVVGARSAVFAPLSDIGLIILDEEHVESYKQDGQPHYHAREVAIMRAKHFGAKVLLGSATPSFETKARAMKGVYGYATILHRANAQELPATEIIDLTDKTIVDRQTKIFSKPLLDKMMEKVGKGEQAILLINRRGYSSYVSCSRCGHIFSCPGCRGNLTYHKEDGMLKCHHCGYVAQYPEVCPECGSTQIMRVGFGTERICKILNERFPELRVGRLDSDIGKVRNNVQKTLDAFKRHEYDVLVGTQMIAKGHDFPLVTLVGVVLADIGLSLPSFRANETTFELIAQCVGRSGRGESKGEALIQTYNPTHFAITLGAEQNYEAFYRREMQNRHISLYPPYAFLIAISISAKSEEKCVQASHALKDEILKAGFEDVTVLGPVTPYFSIVGDRHQRSLLVKYKKAPGIKKYLSDLQAEMSGKGGVEFGFDVDPIDY